MTYYDVLGTHRHASSDEIKNAYKKMALRCHPDKNPGNVRAVARFQELIQAYETLIDTSKRQQYDATITYRDFHPANASNFADTSKDWAHNWGGSWSSAAYSHEPPPKSKSYWSKNAKASSHQRRPQEQSDEENWDMPYTEPPQDWYKNWMEDEKKRKKEDERREAARRAAQDQLKILGTSKRLCELLLELTQLESLIKEAKVLSAEYNAALKNASSLDDIAVEEILEINVTLNTLRRERETRVNEYRSLCKKLKKLDENEWQQAKDRLRDWLVKENKINSERQAQHSKTSQGATHPSAQQYTGNKATSPTRAQYSSSAQKRKFDPAAKPFVPRTEYADDSFSSSDHWNGCTKEDEQCKYEEETSDGAYELYDAQDNFSNSGPAFSDADRDTSVSGYSSDHGGSKSADDGCNPAYKNDNERCRAKHVKHRDVEGEFWDFAPGIDRCCLCGRECTGLQCPEFETCGFLACQFCKTRGY